MDVILEVFLIFAGAKAAGELFVRLRLPALAGELLVGVLLGPAVLGWVHVDRASTALADLGIVVLLFAAGLESPIGELVAEGRGAPPPGARRGGGAGRGARGRRARGGWWGGWRPRSGGWWRWGSGGRRPRPPRLRWPPRRSGSRRGRSAISVRSGAGRRAWCSEQPSSTTSWCWP